MHLCNLESNTLERVPVCLFVLHCSDSWLFEWIVVTNCTLSELLRNAL